MLLQANGYDGAETSRLQRKIPHKIQNFGQPWIPLELRQIEVSSRKKYVFHQGSIPGIIHFKETLQRIFNRVTPVLQMNGIVSINYAWEFKIHFQI